MAKAASLGYVILYVDDFDGALKFYEKVFGFREKMRQGTYGELDTGATTLSFVEREFVESHLGLKPGAKGAGSSEIAIIVPREEVASYFEKAIAAGATAVAEPKEQPWGQIVSYVRDLDGHLVEICSPVG